MTNNQIPEFLAWYVVYMSQLNASPHIIVDGDQLVETHS